MNQNSYHILIYGLLKDEQMKCISPFKEYKVSKELTFIGFQFDRIDRVYQDYNHDTDVLTISNSSPSQAIKDLFNETYPNKEAKCYCLFRNRSELSSRYGSGSVVYGYWLDAEGDDLSDLLSDLRGYDVNGMMMFCPDHVQSDSISHQFFYGKLLAELPCTEDDNEEDHELLANNFMKIYRKQDIPSKEECINAIISKCNSKDFLLSVRREDDNFLAKSKNIILSGGPVITVICDMCYCCT